MVKSVCPKQGVPHVGLSQIFERGVPYISVMSEDIDFKFGTELELASPAKKPMQRKNRRWVRGSMSKKHLKIMGDSFFLQWLQLATSS